MPRSSFDIVAGAIAVVAGVLSWDLVRLIGGRREAWDDPSYWIVGYPLMLAAAFLLGLGYPERPWRWGVIITAAQAVWVVFLALLADGPSDLLPFGIFTFAILALPCIAAAYAGRWLRRRLPE